MSSTRARRGAGLLAGAALFALAFSLLDLEFWWTPLGVGLVYLLGSIAGGPGGGFWATATVLVGWGLAVVWLNEANPDVNVEAAHVFGIGVGALAAAALARRGFRLDLLGVAATATAAGLIFMLERQLPDLLARWETYALLVAAVGLVNLVRRPREPETARAAHP